MVEMVTCVASWYDCTSKQSGYVQLSVREVSEKFADRKFAFGTPAFRNHDLICIALFCLIPLSFVHNICCAKVVVEMECIREANDVQFVFGISGLSSILCKTKYGV